MSMLMFASPCIIALRAHLLHNMQASSAAQKPVSQSPPDQRGSVASHDDNLNIDPAISGVGVNHQQPPQGIPQIQHPPHPQQHQQPQQNIQIQGATQEMQSHSPEGEGSSETPKRGGKRELSTSKRAAQNRAAQRAFRQRKEGYIKKLEEQVRDMTALEESYKAIQNENYQLRDYIISLQSRLIESQGEDAVPPAPILITHQQPQQTLPFQPPPPGVATLPHAQPPQGQPVHAPPPSQQQQAAPTAPMGVPVPVAPQQPQHVVPQAQMVAVPPPKQQQQAQQQAALENGPVAAAKRALEEGDGAYAEYVKKKLRGEDVASPAQQGVAPAAVVEGEVNGGKA
ncbi:hypothetical protein EV426DRAFT_369493 [Tirmania nivea]|nr:hypothetical protein EV426DRAFT_369493 [Tirmania nivea]